MCYDCICYLVLLRPTEIHQTFFWPVSLVHRLRNQPCNQAHPDQWSCTWYLLQILWISLPSPSFSSQASWFLNVFIILSIRLRYKILRKFLLYMFHTFHFLNGKHSKQLDSVLVIFNRRVYAIIRNGPWANKRQFHLDLWESQPATFDLCQLLNSNWAQIFVKWSL